MKENKYNDETFFKKYGEMARSKHGLQGAGEWTTMQEVLPDLTNKRILDIGCGYGWHCKYMSDHGAKQIIGCDISSKMLEIAKEKTVVTLLNIVVLQWKI